MDGHAHCASHKSTSRVSYMAQVKDKSFFLFLLPFYWLILTAESNLLQPAQTNSQEHCSNRLNRLLTWSAHKNPHPEEGCREPAQGYTHCMGTGWSQSGNWWDQISQWWQVSQGKFVIAFYFHVHMLTLSTYAAPHLAGPVWTSMPHALEQLVSLGEDCSEEEYEWQVATVREACTRTKSAASVICFGTCQDWGVKDITLQPIRLVLCERLLGYLKRSYWFIIN